MTWIFEVSVEGAIFEPKKINFFLGTDKLLMIEIKSKRAYNHVGAWYSMTQSKGKYFFGYNLFLVVAVVVGENIDSLKFNTFCRGGEREMITKTIITLKSTYKKDTSADF